MSEPDPINHPAHYTGHPSGIECITITEHMNFNIGNAVKYLWRAGSKTEDPTEDLLKACWYIQREIKRLTAAETTKVNEPAHDYEVGGPDDHRLYPGSRRLGTKKGWHCSGCSWNLGYDVLADRAREVWFDDDRHRVQPAKADQ